MVADTRTCEQCGTSFVPRREHARFCSARCRVAWNRGHMGDPQAGASALVWSITAMSETAERLARAREWDRPGAFAVIGEAVKRFSVYPWQAPRSSVEGHCGHAGPPHSRLRLGGY